MRVLTNYEYQLSSLLDISYHHDNHRDNLSKHTDEV